MAKVHAWSGDAYLRVIVTHGVDVKAVSRKTRYVDAEQKAAVFVRDHGGRVLEGCNADRREALSSEGRRERR